MLTSITSIPSGMATNASPSASSRAHSWQRTPGCIFISRNLDRQRHSGAARRITPYLAQVIMTQRVDATMFGAGQRMVCVAHAAQHCAIGAALACVVSWHNLFAVAQLLNEMRSLLYKSIGCPAAPQGRLMLRRQSSCGYAPPPARPPGCAGDVKDCHEPLALCVLLVALHQSFRRPPLWAHAALQSASTLLHLLTPRCPARHPPVRSTAAAAARRAPLQKSAAVARPRAALRLCRSRQVRRLLDFWR